MIKVKMETNKKQLANVAIDYEVFKQMQEIRLHMSTSDNRIKIGKLVEDACKEYIEIRAEK